MITDFNLFNDDLASLWRSKIRFSTLNAYSYTLTLNNRLFREALEKSDVLLPDGIGVVWAVRWLTGCKLKKIAGEDLFFHEMKSLQQECGKAFFLGSSEDTLIKIVNRASMEFPNVKVGVYSPPFKREFSVPESDAMISSINAFAPDVLFVGMTAPKQEKWCYTYFDRLNARHVCCIGAVFDFYAGTKKRAPRWVIRLGLEWLHRLISEPKRLWFRYLVGNTRFVLTVIGEKFFSMRH